MTISADSYMSIQRLIYLHAHIFDSGDFDRLHDLYEKAEWVNADSPGIDAATLVKSFKEMILLYDGSPRTHHLMHNPMIDLSTDNRSACAQTVVQVLQAIPPEFPMQTILVGTYSDQFVRDDAGQWHFSRRVTNASYWGDVSRHVALAG